MQVPEYIINKINEGEATYHTNVLGGGSAYEIPVPENKYIVIFGYTYHHFLDLGSFINFNEAFKNCVHLLQFQSKARRYLYCHRSNFIPVVSAIETQVNFMPLTPDTQVSVYQKHEANVNVTIWRMPHPLFWAVNSGPVPRGDTDIEAQPLNIGVSPTGETVILDIAPNVAIQPGWLINEFPDYNPGGGGNLDFKSPIQLANMLNPVIPDPSNKMVFQYPIVTVHYALFNKNSKKTDRP